MTALRRRTGSAAHNRALAAGASRGAAPASEAGLYDRLGHPYLPPAPAS